VQFCKKDSLFSSGCEEKSTGRAEARLQFIGVMALRAVGYSQKAAHKYMFAALTYYFPLPGRFYVGYEQIFTLLLGSHIPS
jgi:hypothetical protein